MADKVENSSHGPILCGVASQTKGASQALALSAGGHAAEGGSFA